MCFSIQFFDSFNTVLIKEIKLPLIKLTKSKSGKTGTATFIFINPILFSRTLLKKKDIMTMSLIAKERKISTNNITLFFKEGEPYLLKSIFLFKNSEEWFFFLQFISFYAKENALLFSS